jgi:hypothetical protein
VESDLIRADMIEATEFPHLVQRYAIFEVPRMVINQDLSVTGPGQEEKLLSEITRAIETSV